MTRFRIAPQLLSIASLLVLSGCVELGLGGVTPPSRLYLLAALAEPASRSDGPGLGVGPIRLARYLDRPQIVTRGPGPRIEVAEFDRWAEPLEESVARVLAENLSRQLGTDRVQRHPFRSGRAVELAVEVDVTRFDGEPGGAVVLEAWWRLRGEDALLQRGSRIVEEAQGPGFDALAAAMSRALATLSRHIADAAPRAPETGL